MRELISLKGLLLSDKSDDVKNNKTIETSEVIQTYIHKL